MSEPPIFTEQRDYKYFKDAFSVSNHKEKPLPTKKLLRQSTREILGAHLEEIEKLKMEIK